MESPNLKRKRQSTGSFQLIIGGFFLLILTGALLLMLPIASQDRQVTPFIETLFTSVSCTCVTGLVVQDTATHWSLFGQAVILLLIQIGGMGVITVALALIRLTGRKIGLRQRSIMQESISAPQIGNILSLTGFILKTSAAIELIGAALLSPVFIRDFGLAKGLWYALFHSVSAFCNAGFDLLGVREKFSSLTTYSDNAYFNVVIMLLIIIGGISFMTWSDIRTYKHQIRRYSLQSKIILMTTAFLIFVPAICFFFFEYRQEPIVKRILCSLFQSVTARTAGFNTADLSAMHESGTALMIMLMLTGGAPGSTAGGMKVTTIAVLFLSAVAVFRRKNDVTSFNRRISEEAIRNAGAILFIYVCLFMTTGIAISHIEGLPLLTCLFETGSAAGTAGLTLGITTSLSTPSHIMLMLLMFFGRMGGLTMIYAAVPSSAGESARMPLEKINVG